DTSGSSRHQTLLIVLRDRERQMPTTVSSRSREDLSTPRNSVARVAQASLAPVGGADLIRIDDLPARIYRELGIRRSTAACNRWVQPGLCGERLPAVRVGRHRFVAWADVLDFFGRVERAQQKKREAASAPPPAPTRRRRRRPGGAQ